MKRNIYVFGICVIFLLGMSVTVKGQSLREKSRQVLKRTEIVLAIGRQAVKKNQVYTGDLAKAQNHQNYAAWQFRQQNFARCIYHSRRARKLAAKSIRANQENVPEDILMEEPIVLPGSPPSEMELDQDMEMNVANRIYSDEDAARMSSDPNGF